MIFILQYVGLVILVIFAISANNLFSLLFWKFCLLSVSKRLTCPESLLRLPHLRRKKRYGIVSYINFLFYSLVIAFETVWNVLILLHCDFSCGLSPRLLLPKRSPISSKLSIDLGGVAVVWQVFFAGIRSWFITISVTISPFSEDWNIRVQTPQTLLLQQYLSAITCHELWARLLI